MGLVSSATSGFTQHLTPGIRLRQKGSHVRSDQRSEFLFQLGCGRFFSCDGRVDLISVGMIVCQGRRNLGQREMTELVRDLLGAKAEPVPADDPLYRHAGAGNARPVATDGWRPDNEVPMLATVLMVSVLSAGSFHYAQLPTARGHASLAVCQTKQKGRCRELAPPTGVSF